MDTLVEPTDTITHRIVFPNSMTSAGCGLNGSRTRQEHVMEFSVDSLKSSAKTVREALLTVAVSVKSTAARQLWSYTLAGHQKFESLVEQAKRDGTVSLTPDPKRMIEWGKQRNKEISLHIATYAITEALSDFSGESTLNLPTFNEKSVPAYHSNVSGPYPAFIAMNESGRVFLDYGDQAYIDYATGRTLCWDVDPCLSGYELNMLLNKIKPLLEYVHAGHTIEWNERSHVGRLTLSAQESSEAIQELCSLTHSTNIVVTAYDYCYSVQTALEIWPEGMTLDAVVSQIESSQGDSLILVGDLRDALLRGVKEEFDNAEDILPEHILLGLLAEGAISSNELTAYREEFNLI